MKLFQPEVETVGDSDDGVTLTPSEQHASESNHRHHKSKFIQHENK